MRSTSSVLATVHVSDVLSTVHWVTLLALPKRHHEEVRLHISWKSIISTLSLQFAEHMSVVLSHAFVVQTSSRKARKMSSSEFFLHIFHVIAACEWEHLSSTSKLLFRHVKNCVPVDVVFQTIHDYIIKSFCGQTLICRPFVPSESQNHVRILASCRICHK